MRINFLPLSYFFFIIIFMIGLGIVVLTQPFVFKAQLDSPPLVDKERLEHHVRYLSVDLYPRSYDQISNINQAAHYIQTELSESGGSVSVQEFKVDGINYQNIIAKFGPSLGSKIVVGAHYDSHGDVTSGAAFPAGYSLETHTPGADDNASGIAGLLELARLLGQNPPVRPVELVAFTLEEPPYFRTPFMGSAWHARSILETHQNVALMISLEMIGYFSDDKGSQSFPIPVMSYLYSDRGNFISLVGKLSDFGAMRRVKALMRGTTDLPIYSMNAPSFLMGIDFSDHLNYWAAGIPAIMVTDTAFYRNFNYHSAGDTYDRLDYKRMAKVVQGIYSVTKQY